MSRRIAILGGNNYGQPDAIRKVVNVIPKTSTLIITSGAGVCLIAKDEAERTGLPNKTFKWRCQPYALFRNCDAAVVFEDPAQSIYLFLKYAALRNFPVLMYDDRGNPIDFRKYLSSNPNRKDKSMPQLPPSAELGRPSLDTTGEGKLKITLTVSESLYNKYNKQGDIQKVTPERAMTLRLEKCAEYNDSRPLYFPDGPRVELEKLTGGRMLNSAEQAVEKVKELARIQVSGTFIELSPNILQRVESRAKAERTTINKWIEKEVLRSMEEAVGIR